MSVQNRLPIISSAVIARAIDADAAKTTNITPKAIVIVANRDLHIVISLQKEPTK